MVFYTHGQYLGDIDIEEFQEDWDTNSSGWLVKHNRNGTTMLYL
jgi:hypothetical protein